MKQCDLCIDDAGIPFGFPIVISVRKSFSSRRSLWGCGKWQIAAAAIAKKGCKLQILPPFSSDEMSQICKFLSCILLTR